jgi:CelD/BcsL family acetyltransferase involved in cellulose biosynthesis
LRFGMMDVDGETVAVQSWIVNGGLATGAKLAFDERFKKYHVGALLMLHTIAHVIDEDCVDEIDFGLHATDYKSRWLSQQREIWGIAAFDPRTRAGLATLLRYDGREMLARAWRIGKKFQKAAKFALAKGAPH